MRPDISSPYLDVMTVTSSQSPVALGDQESTHSKLLVEPISVPDLKHCLGRTKGQDSRLFYDTRGRKRRNIRGVIRQAIRNAETYGPSRRRGRGSRGGLGGFGTMSSSPYGPRPLTVASSRSLNSKRSKRRGRSRGRKHRQPSRSRLSTAPALNSRASMNISRGSGTPGEALDPLYEGGHTSSFNSQRRAHTTGRGGRASRGGVQLGARRSIALRVPAMSPKRTGGLFPTRSRQSDREAADLLTKLKMLDRQLEIVSLT